ncbi:MAG: M56 family metallopeptidase [Bacteroidales bacterium]|nr:M56 family metallopeptidase [Bacteroidales bacterium]
MEAFFVYIIESSLVLFVGVTMFMLLLRRETFHRLNRGLLLGIIFISLLSPLINTGYSSTLSQCHYFIKAAVGGGMHGAFMEYRLPRATQTADVILVDDAVANENAIAANTSRGNITLRDCLSVIYFSFVALFVVRLIYMYIQVLFILRRCKPLMYRLANGRWVSLRVHHADYAPFSWFGYICVSHHDLSSSPDDIILHEMAHVSSKHSLDILLSDMLIVVQWFNPMAWIIKSMLKDIHEYEADAAVIASGIDTKRYQLLIIKKAVGARLYSIANSFNHSLTLKRITMMCKKKSSLWHTAKALYVVPMAITAVCAFSSSSDGVDASVDKVSEKTLHYNGVAKIIPTEKVDTVFRSYVGAAADAVGMDKKQSTDQVYEIVEQQPVFPGGAYELMTYLRKHIKYPLEAMNSGMQGKAFVGFIVGNDGSVSSVKIVKSSGHEQLDAEAVRVVSEMPKWQPGRQRGEAVNVRYTLPIIFRLQSPPMKENATPSKAENTDASVATP